jgi:hypothetical protein
MKTNMQMIAEFLISTYGDRAIAAVEEAIEIANENGESCCDMVCWCDPDDEGVPQEYARCENVFFQHLNTDEGEK